MKTKIELAKELVEYSLRWLQNPMNEDCSEVQDDE